MKMKIIAALSFAFAIHLFAFAQVNESPIYKIEAKKYVFNSEEQTIIFLTISNPTENEYKHIGYGFTAEHFTIYDSKGNRQKDSMWVQRLRCKKRNEEPIIIPPQGEKVLMYTLGQLIEPSIIRDSLTVKIKDTNLKIDTPFIYRTPQE